MLVKIRQALSYGLAEGAHQLGKGLSDHDSLHCLRLMRNRRFAFADRPENTSCWVVMLRKRQLKLHVEGVVDVVVTIGTFCGLSSRIGNTNCDIGVGYWNVACGVGRSHVRRQLIELAALMFTNDTLYLERNVA